MAGNLVPFDLRTESPITLKEAVKQIPSPRTDSGTIAIVTIRKWLLDGVKIGRDRTVQLQGVRMGRSLMTSRESILRFVEATSGATDNSQLPGKTLETNGHVRHESGSSVASTSRRKPQKLSK